MVMMNPRIKHRNSTIPRFLDWAILVPIFSPIGVIASSAPKVKNIMPMIRRTAPNRNKSNMLGGIGAMVKLNRITIPIVGSTAIRASFNFSLNLFR